MDNINDDLLLNVPPPPVPPPPPPRPLPSSVKLPPFWPDAPLAWFAAVEAQFRLRGVAREVDRFCLVAAALDKDTVRQVVHLVAEPDPVAPYTRLKDALLASHVLTDFQRVELLLALGPLGDRKPSQLLAEMLELCPRDEHGSKLFAALFLQRMPREIRVLLAHDDHTDLRALAVKADQLLVFHKLQLHESSPVASATCQEDADTVAALRFGGKSGKQNGGKQHGGKKQKPPLPPNRKKDGPPPPLDLAQQSSGLCFYHWNFGENARNCRSPCSWQGN